MWAGEEDKPQALRRREVSHRKGTQCKVATLGSAILAGIGGTVPITRLRWRWAILGGGVGLYLAGLGFLGAAALNQYDQAKGQWRGDPKQLDYAAQSGQDASNSPWTAHLRRVDAALAKNDVRAAERAWHDAYGEAFRSGRWDGMVQVGDAYRRIGEVTGSRKASAEKARETYWAALSLARHQGSLDGVLRTAEAFAALGDRKAAEECVRVAELLTAQDSEAQADVRMFRERLAVMLIATEQAEFK